MHDIIAEMRQVVDAYQHRMLVGEVNLPIEKLVAYYGTGGNTGVHMPFNFQLITLKWNALAIAEVVQKYEAALPKYGWPNWVLGNHDNPRIASRAGSDQTRVAAMLLLTLRGTPTLYYGDEIGMADGLIAPHQVQDPFEKQVPGMGLGRDPERTPMRWDATPMAGFSTVESWLPIGSEVDSVNVDVQAREAGSLLSLYHQLIRLRREHSALNVGAYQQVHADVCCLAYLRTSGDEKCLIALNFSNDPQTARTNLPGHGAVVLSTRMDRGGERVGSDVTLRPFEGLLVSWTHSG